MMGHANGRAGWQLLVMVVYPVIFAGLLTVGLTWALRTMRPDAAAKIGAPQQVLAERYARGELTDEEYRHRLDTLDHT